MALVIKLLFRLDYPVSFPYMDRPGTALSLYGDLTGKVWKNLGEGQANRSFVAEHKEKSLYRNVTMEPKSLNGDISILGGIEFSKIHSDENFRLVEGLINKFMKEFQLKELSRCGIRYICVEKVGGDTPQKLSRALKIVDTKVVAAASEKLGEVKDVGVVFEGQDGSGINYRATFGPLFEKDIKSHLSRLEPDDAAVEYLTKNDLIFDIDLWEKDFAFVANSFYRWCEDKHAAAQAFVKEIVSKVHELNSA